MPSVQITRTSPRSFRSLQKLLTNFPCNVQCLFPQGKLDTLSGKGEREEQGQGDAGPMDGAIERIRYIWTWKPLSSMCSHIRELELELAQTKLALVETECKNQDLTHRFTVAQVSRTPVSPGFDLSQIIRISREPPVGLSPTLGCPRLSVPSRKWLVRTSISIVVFLIL